MNFNEYQKESRKTWKVKYKNDLERALLGLFGEAGEVAEKYKKSMRDDTEINTKDMAKELGDILYYITRLAEYNGHTLEQVAKSCGPRFESTLKFTPKGNKPTLSTVREQTLARNSFIEI